MTSFQASQQSICAVRTQTKNPVPHLDLSTKRRLMGPGCACVGREAACGGSWQRLLQGLPSHTQGHHLPREGAAHLPSGDHSLLVAELTVPPAGLRPRPWPDSGGLRLPLVGVQKTAAQTWLGYPQGTMNRDVPELLPSLMFALCCGPALEPSLESKAS